MRVKITVKGGRGVGKTNLLNLLAEQIEADHGGQVVKLQTENATRPKKEGRKGLRREVLVMEVPDVPADPATVAGKVG